ncbi:hypothetical protein N2152v2_007706 [Parachlorella kessleri]
MSASHQHLAALFEDTYLTLGHDPQRALLERLLSNASATLAGGGAGAASAVAQALAQALQQLPLAAGQVAGPGSWPAFAANATAATGFAAGMDEGFGGVLAGVAKKNHTSPDDPSKGGPVDISILGLVLATALVAVNGLVSVWLHLGLHGKLAIATVRCILQLSLLGYILVPIFVTNKWWLTLLYTLFMLAVAAIEAVSRPTQTYGGMLLQVLMALGIASSLVLSYGLAVVVQVHPWYDAQYLIPMLGMLLGNACSGIAVGLSTVLEELSTGRDKVESLLAMGATRLEATRELIQRSTRVALTPILNQMNVVGVVSIPGMMTGQILGGSDPATAARYQIIIMFLIGATTAIASVFTIFTAVFSIVDDKQRLRAERLHAKAGTAKGAVAFIGEQITSGWSATRRGVSRVSTRVRTAFGAATPRGGGGGGSRQRHAFGRAGSAAGGSEGGQAYSQVPADEGRDGEEGGGGSRPALREVVVGNCSGRADGLAGQGSLSPRRPLLDGQPGSP